MIVGESKIPIFLVINQKSLHHRRLWYLLHLPVRRVNDSDMHKGRRSDTMSREDCKRSIRSVSLSTNTLHFKVRHQIMGFDGTIAVWCGTARRPLQMWRSLTGSSDWTSTLRRRYGWRILLLFRKYTLKTWVYISFSFFAKYIFALASCCKRYKLPFYGHLFD